MHCNAMVASASATRTLVVFALLLFICLAVQTVAGRNVATDSKLDPQFLGHFDGSVLIPGIGRFMIPKNKKDLKSFHYNPITGAPGGGGAGVSGPGSGGASGEGGHIPGGDDTFLPNPGVEVPNPAAGRGTPVPTGP